MITITLQKTCYKIIPRIFKSIPRLFSRKKKKKNISLFYWIVLEDPVTKNSEKTFPFFYQEIETSTVFHDDATVYFAG